MGIPLVLLAGVFWSTSGIVYRLIEEATAWQVLINRSIALLLMMITILIVKNRKKLIKLIQMLHLYDLES